MISLIVFLWVSSTFGQSVDSAPTFKDQKTSSTKWGEVKIDSFLNFKDWKDQSDERDFVPEWESIVRERSNREIVGRFVQCVGHCRVDRGQSFFKPSFRSSIYEGDEIQTFGESYAWIFLFDGTMVRLSPESSINFNELNIGIKENFLNVRVNMGNILWLSRHNANFEETNARETDVLFFPLEMYEAQAVPEKKTYSEDNLLEMVEEKKTVFFQYQRLNSLIAENNKLTKSKPTFAFIVMPNITLMGQNPSLEIISLLGGKTFFKKRSPQFLGHSKDVEDEEVVAQMRGFENAVLTPVESDKWLEMDEKGRSLTTAFNNTYWLSMGEFITKRIPSIMVARELLLQKYSEFAFRENYDPKILAQKDGYRLWGPDIKLRLDFLKEYFRRIETTNLLVSNQFSERLKERGESIKAMEYGNYFFIAALDKYYSYEEYTDEKETGIVLNSTTKALWKRMHGLK